MRLVMSETRRALTRKQRQKLTVVIVVIIIIVVVVVNVVVVVVVVIIVGISIVLRAAETKHEYRGPFDLPNFVCCF